MARAVISGRGADEVKLVTRPSGFWLRLRLNLKQLRRRLWWLVAGGSVLPTLLLPLTFLGESWPFELGRGELFVIAVAANVALLIGVALIAALVQAVFPSNDTKRLPESVTLRRDGLRVKPRHEDAYEDTYDFVLSASRAGGGLDLQIGDEPPLILHVTPVMIGQSKFDLIEHWLERHGKLAPTPVE